METPKGENRDGSDGQVTDFWGLTRLRWFGPEWSKAEAEGIWKRRLNGIKHGIRLGVVPFQPGHEAAGRGR